MQLADKDLEGVPCFEPTGVLKSQILLFLAINKIFGIIESLIQIFQCQFCPGSLRSCVECSYLMFCSGGLWQIHVAVVEQDFKRVIETLKSKSTHLYMLSHTISKAEL